MRRRRRALGEATASWGTTMDDKSLAATIDAAWEKRDTITPATKGEIRDAVEAAMEGLDRGTYRVAAPEAGQWTTQQWLKKALLLYFRLRDSASCRGRSSAARPT